MLSYVVRDLGTLSGIYEDLSEEDAELIADAVESGSGVRLFQDGSLVNEQTSELILAGVDDDLLDEDSFRAEAEQVGSDLESEVEDFEEGPELAACPCYML